MTSARNPRRREILSWLDEAAAEKEQAELALKAAMELAPPSLSVEEVSPSSSGAADSRGSSTQATDAERAGLYASMGVSAVYDPEHNEVRLGVDPVASTVCRRGDTNPKYTRPLGGLAHRCMKHREPDYSRNYSRDYSRNYSRSGNLFCCATRSDA